MACGRARRTLSVKQHELHHPLGDALRQLLEPAGPAARGFLPVRQLHHPPTGHQIVMLITGEIMDKFKALRTMMDAIHPDHRAYTMCASADQTTELLAEIDRLNATIESLHAARGGILMDEAGTQAAQGPVRPAPANTVPQAANAIAVALADSQRTNDGGYVQCVNKVPCNVQQVAIPAASGAVDPSAGSAMFNGFDISKLPSILISCVAKLWPGTNGLFWDLALEKMPDRIEQLMARPTAEGDGDLPAIDQATVDKHLGAVLRASGSALRHFSTQKTLDDMRAAMLAAMVRPTANGVGGHSD
jgi:hypothetical protein